MSLGGVDFSTLPRLPRTQASGLPARIPALDAHLPSLVDDPPGHAVLVLNPSITVLNIDVASWSELEFLVYGVDGHWRRLNLGDLGLDEALRYSDTYGAGHLSSDGRWWLGPTRDGSLLVDMRSGGVRLLASGSGDWIPGRDAILVRGAEIDMASGMRTRVPYDYFSVGYEPDGTPLSLARSATGGALLVEWRGRTHRLRTEVAGLEPPPETTGEQFGRCCDYTQLGQVMATTGMVAQTQSPARNRLAIVVADSRTGEEVGRITWRDSDFDLFYDDWWLDEQTMLIATAPYFLAWRPRTGKVFRVTDARAIADNYWDMTTGSQAVSP